MQRFQKLVISTLSRIALLSCWNCKLVTETVFRHRVEQLATPGLGADRRAVFTCHLPRSVDLVFVSTWSSLQMYRLLKNIYSIHEWTYLHFKLRCYSVIYKVVSVWYVLCGFKLRVTTSWNYPTNNRWIFLTFHLSQHWIVVSVKLKASLPTGLVPTFVFSFCGFLFKESAANAAAAVWAEIYPLRLWQYPPFFCFHIKNKAFAILDYLHWCCVF